MELVHFAGGLPGNPQRTGDNYVKKTWHTWATPSSRQFHSDAVTIKRVTACAFIGTKRYVAIALFERGRERMAFRAGLLYLLRFERVDNLSVQHPVGDRPSHPI